MQRKIEKIIKTVEKYVIISIEKKIGKAGKT